MNTIQKNKLRYVLVICLYILFCICITVASSHLANKSVSTNNLELMDNTIGLMAEKVNNTINIMTGYVEEASVLLSSNRDFNYQENYDEIKSTKNNLPYMSIGFIDTVNSKIYGNASELNDFTKYNFMEIASKSNGVYITQPYRAIGTGTNVITMFDAIHNSNNQVTGYVFVTYALEQIQSIASTSILENEAEIYIMDSRSGNYIHCTETKDYPAGSWFNIAMEKADFKCLAGYDLNDWLNNMKNGEDMDVLCFDLNGTTYTQAFRKIDNMNGWYVVVRIPSHFLSNNLEQTIRILTITLCVMLLATIMLAGFLLHSEIFQKKLLQDVSSHDHLTNAKNRRAFDSVLDSYFKSKNLKPSAIIAFDMDNFKPVNDTYGHDVGDQLLIAFAKNLEKIFGKNGVVVRMGGDEFSVFLQGISDRNTIDLYLEALRKDLSCVHISDDIVLDVHFSVGVSCFPTDTDEPELFEKYADKALYYAKNNGRNCTCWYSDIKQ